MLECPDMIRLQTMYPKCVQDAPRTKTNRRGALQRNGTIAFRRDHSGNLAEKLLHEMRERRNFLLPHHLHDVGNLRDINQ